MAATATVIPAPAKFRVTTRIETTSKVSGNLWSLPRWIDAMLILRNKVTAGRQIKAMAKFKGTTLTSVGRHPVHDEFRGH